MALWLIGSGDVSHSTGPKASPRMIRAIPSHTTTFVRRQAIARPDETLALDAEQSSRPH
jgi:hypothetical protein